MKKHVRIENGNQIPESFGALRQAKSVLTVGIREPNGVETFELSWGTLTAIPGEDLVIVAPTEEYPCKKDIFASTYEEVAPGRFRKCACSQLVQVPEDVVATVVTLEGDLEVEYPDYVAVGKKNEVWANLAPWVAENLEFVG